MAAPRGEVKVMTAKRVVHVTLNGDIRTVSDAVKDAGEDPTNCTIRVDGALCTNLDTVLEPGQAVSAFKTQTVATAGVKGAVEVTAPDPIDDESGDSDDGDDEDGDEEDAEAGSNSKSEASE